MAAQTPAKQLYDMLVSKNFDITLLDGSGRPSQDPAETDVFSFDYESESGHDYGTIVLMLADDNDLQVYFGDNLGKGMEQEDKKGWFDFLYQLKQFATKNLMTFSLKNLNRLKYSMQGQAAIKEGLFESWSGTKTQSWNGKLVDARLMIRHSRPIYEGEKRYRYIESLFIETAEGERFKLPFTKLSGGRAMVEHVRMGGKVHDIRGQHITEMVNELNVLSQFRRANQGRIFEGDTAALVEQTNMYYKNLQHNLKQLSSNRGYKHYFESWKPLEVSEQEVVIEGLKHLFVIQNIDQRVEQALPLLARIQQQGNAMKEANIFENWANRLMEGTWATPDTEQKQDALVKLLSQELPVGADATNATEQLYNLLGDDQLFDNLYELSIKDVNADARQTVLDRMQELSYDPEVAQVIAKLNIDIDQPVDEVKDPETQTEDPAGTEEKPYPEYEQDLQAILKQAGVPAEQRAAPDYEPELDEEANPGVTPADIDGVPEEDLEEAENLSPFTEARCNMSEAGTMCEVHGLKECGMYEETSVLQGQYGHSGKMKPVSESEADIVSRLKELSGLLTTTK